MNSSSLSVVAFGGDEASARELVKTGNIKAYFNQKDSLDSFVPMSYVIRNMKDHSIAAMSETTKYKKKNCNPIPAKAFKTRITIQSIFMKNTGASSQGEIYGSLSLSHSSLGEKVIWSRTRDQYISTKNKTDLKTNLIEEPVDFILPVSSHESVKLKALFKDNDGIWSDDKVAEFNVSIAYDQNSNLKETNIKDGRPTKGHFYQTDSQEDVTVFYSLERLEPIYCLSPIEKKQYPAVCR
jgi:hypothetical protein